MGKWEYGWFYYWKDKAYFNDKFLFKLSFTGNENPLDEWNKLGKEGWEMVQMRFRDNGVVDAVYFKRPIED